MQDIYKRGWRERPNLISSRGLASNSLASDEPEYLANFAMIIPETPTRSAATYTSAASIK